MSAPRSREMHYFWMLSQSEQIAAIRKMATQGLGDYTIAAATALSVESVRKAIGQRGALSEPHL